MTPCQKDKAAAELTEKIAVKFSITGEDIKAGFDRYRLYLRNLEAAEAHLADAQQKLHAAEMNFKQAYADCIHDMDRGLERKPRAPTEGDEP